MKKNSLSVTCAIFVFSSWAMSLVFAETRATRVFGKDHPFTIEELPTGKLKSKLLTIAPAAREKAMKSLHSLTFQSFDAADHLRVDQNGGIFIVCPDSHGNCDGKHHSHGSTENPSAESPSAPSADAAPSPGTGSASVSVASPPAYHSKPGAPYHIYLDFNGAIVAGKAWNQEYRVTSWDCLAWSADADTTTFSDSEQSDMRRIWERIAEDYAPFNINVTTDVAYDPVNYKGDKNKVGWLLFTPTKDKKFEHCPHYGTGGIAYVTVRPDGIGVFGGVDYFNQYQPAWVNTYVIETPQNPGGPISAANMAEAGSHEMGHNMGLRHDGTSADEYYKGHDGTGSSPSWGTIMGASYRRDVSQWSKGEYYDYFNQYDPQDDLAIISSKVPYKQDDHGDSFATATAWPDADVDEQGIVEKTGNADYFEFTAGAGPVYFSATSYRCDTDTWGGNLDIQLDLYDESLTLVSSSNPAAETNAVLTKTVAAGTYYLVLKPSAAGNPLSNPPSGYKLYGSLGQYSIAGRFVPTDTVVLSAPNGGEFWTGGTTQTISWLSALGGNVKIELLKNGLFDSTVIASTPNDGSYDWSIPIGQAAAADYRIRITSVETPEKADTSASDFTISPIPLPEIYVEQPVGVKLVDGASTVNFGDSIVGSPVPLAITIRNTGTANLTGLAVSKSGTNEGDFVLEALGQTDLAPGSETTLTVVFTPSELGARTASLQISSNDADENPFDLELTGVGLAAPAPDIAVEQPVDTDLTDGFSTVDFGSTNLGAQTSLTFTIRNKGNLNLTGLSVSKIGTQASEFAVSTLRSSSLSPGASLTFTVGFKPSSAGIRSASLRIASNDSDENPFDISLTGVGVIPFVPDIVVIQPTGEELRDGDPMKGFGFVNVGQVQTRTFTIRNSGIDNLTDLTAAMSGSHVSDFVIGTFGATTVAPGEETTLMVTFAPTNSGNRYAVLRIGSNDLDENPFDIELSGAGVIPKAPEISVEQPLRTNLLDGSAAIAFGDTNINTPVTKTVTVFNTGTAALADLAVSLSGANASDFDLGALSSTTVASGASVTFTVTFNPSTLGAYGADLQIASNDEDENPFDIVLSGTGVVPPAPEIVVEHPAGTGLVDGVSELAFGNPVIGTPVTKTIILRNTGTANLTGLAVARTGTNAPNFTLGSLGANGLAPGASTTFTVTFTPSVVGKSTATAVISSNDADENPFEIALIGNGVIPPAPEIVVEHPAGTNLVKGSATIAFGNSNIGTPVARTVTLRNTGTANLTGLSVTRSGLNTSDYVTGALGTTTLAPGAGTTFTVTFTPSASGIRTASLRIASNDADENPFGIALSGTGVVPPAPEITVQQGNGPDKNLTDKVSIRNFGEVKAGTVSKAMVFTIKNTGSTTLTQLDVIVRGGQARNFQVTEKPASSLAPGSSAKFKVIFKPTGATISNTTLQITSNDADENPFRVKLTGKGVR